MPDVSVVVQNLERDIKQLLDLVDSDPDVLGCVSVSDYLWLFEIVRLSLVYKDFGK